MQARGFKRLKNPKFLQGDWESSVLKTVGPLRSPQPQTSMAFSMEGKQHSPLLNWVHN